VEKIGLLFVFALIGAAGAPEAEAQVSAACWAHLAENPGTSAAADVRYHLARGEHSPCTQQEAGEADHTNEYSSRDGESRSCNKRWWC
jgi:hypothetical protein